MNEGLVPDPSSSQISRPSFSFPVVMSPNPVEMYTPKSADAIVREPTLQSTTFFEDGLEPTPPDLSFELEPSDYWDSLVGGQLAHYQVESPLGQGSMARVYKARHVGLGRVCALKILDPSVNANQAATREQFWAEARAAANLVHPHVVTIHNLGTDRGYHYIEMEYVPGSMSLREVLVRNGPFDPLLAARLVRQVSLALHAAHRAGLVHRDVKPANVLLTAEGRAKLADFGLVHRTIGLASERLAGTPTFMAPELFVGSPAGPRSDIYATGVMLYYLLSGRLPFASERLRDLIRLHREQPVPGLREVVPSVPEPLADVVARCLSKSPDERYASASDLADALRAVVQGLRDTESLVRESLAGLKCFIQGSRDRFRVVLPQQGGERLQEVMLEVYAAKSAERFLSVFSVCGPARPEHYESALEINSRLTYGSLSIRRVLGSPMLVMSRTFPRDRVRASELRDAIVEIGRRSDQIEQQLSHHDLY